MKRWIKFMFEKHIKPKMNLKEEEAFADRKKTLCSEKVIFS